MAASRGVMQKWWLGTRRVPGAGLGGGPGAHSSGRKSPVQPHGPALPCLAPDPASNRADTALVALRSWVRGGETQNGLPGEVAVSTPWLEVPKRGLWVAWAHHRALGQGLCHPQQLWARLVWRRCCSALKGCG